ncbi:GspE/PulE family protein [Aquincola sp. MAHUQ-54]|uniref:GspE/PulE family protein n=1 Tax=Aquincola agrisoli TaxID=3119538 RepID=A0AAW9QA79_9BURK
MQLRSSLQAARRVCQSGGGAVWDVLRRSTGLPPAELARLLMTGAGVGAWLGDMQAEPDFSAWPLERARALRCVVLRAERGDACIAVAADPWSDDVGRAVTAAIGKTPTWLAAGSDDLARWLGGNGEGSERTTARPASRDSGSPVIDFVDAALRAAYRVGASDVHFECDRAGATVKLRQDGVMSTFARMEGVERAEEVISRIKVLAQLDITERRTPQDGRFRIELGEATIDLRVSIMPSVFGEDAVLRLLDKAQLRSRGDAASLDLLGFEAESSQRIRDLAELPHGMLLVTGPTGSGKTTTVYAVLSEINTGIEKIITIEDPVEYELHGVLQIPVNERKGLTFARGLRSILRHDPDRILVGEIRDPETASIAVQSALTGHQVFTTVHANSIFDVTGRFRHLGVDMFGFMSSLNGVVVQRLIRTCCPHCVGEREPNERELRWLSQLGLAWTAVPKPVGCDACHGTGYRGRSVIAEVHAVDDRLRDLVLGGAELALLRRHVTERGVQSLLQSALTMVEQRKTTIEEVRRVVGWHAA